MKYTIFFILFFGSLHSYGQENYPNCINPEIISFPLKNDSTQEQIYYQQADKYTYWYKIDVNTTGELSYELSSIGTEDDYAILVYNFKGDNFCNDVVNKKVKPTFNKPEGILQTKKGETYYIGVLHINGFGCGHVLKIIDNEKQKIYKTIQNECVEEAMEKIVIEKSMPIKKTDTSITGITAIEKPEIVESKNSIKGVVVNSSTKKSIEAMVTIIDTEKNLQQQINSRVDSGFVLINYSQEKMVVSITKFGYEPLLDTIILTDNNLKIELNPIKVGDKLIMRKIYFHPNTYVLREESKEELKKLNKFMLENSKYLFEIQGHTNGNRNVKKIKRYANLGEEWNFKGTSKKLSKLRAEKIKTYLVKNGVQEIQLKTTGYGGDRMIVAKPKNMEQAMKNIRVEVIVIE